MEADSWLYRPKGHERTPREVEAYIKAAARRRVHDLILREFLRSGMTQADLARRTGKSRESISRIIGHPSNLETNTIAEILFALTGGMIGSEIEYPLQPAQPEAVKALYGSEPKDNLNFANQNWPLSSAEAHAASSASLYERWQ